MGGIRITRDWTLPARKFPLLSKRYVVFGDFFHINTYAHTHTRARAYTHAHTHVHALSPPPPHTLFLSPSPPRLPLFRRAVFGVSMGVITVSQPGKL